VVFVEVELGGKYLWRLLFA